VVLVNLDLHQDNLLYTGFGRVLASISRPLIQASALLIVSLVAIICLDVFSRAVLSEPLRGVTELVSLSIPAIVFLALGYLFVENKLIRADMLLQALAKRSVATADLLQFVFYSIGTLVMLSIALPAIKAFKYALVTNEFLGVEGEFTVPLWPSKLIVLLGSLLLTALCANTAFAYAKSYCRALSGNQRKTQLLALTMTLCCVVFAAGLASEFEGRAAIGLTSIIVLFVFIYAGMPVAFALASSAGLGIGLIKGDFLIAVETLALVADGSVSEYVFAAVPLFVLMGLVVGVADIGRDSLQATHWLLRRVKGGLGVATVAANAVFAAITGISIASAAIFSRIAVPPLIEHGFTPRFAVGLVAGTSVLGMLIPPSLLLIVYGLVAEVSISQLFLAAIIPGLILSSAFALGVVLAVTFRLPFAVTSKNLPHREHTIGAKSALLKAIPVAALVTIVLGGIYGGIFTPTEAGAVGTLAAMVIALVMRRTTIRELAGLTVDAAAGSASILFLIIAASAFAIMLTLSGIPAYLSAQIGGADLGLVSYTIGYLLVLIMLGMVLDSTSILLIMVPLALPTIQALGGDLIWFGIVSVIGVEIGLLTPPLGLSVYAIKASLAEDKISLSDIFIGALPFIFIMLAVTLALIFYPQLTLQL
jgi:C4-dicarboxylate transporter DctM subunit